MKAKLYSLSLSHPAQAARLMLERKRLEFEVTDLLPGFHPLFLRLAGFHANTVPALRIDGRRIQGSLEISRALEELRPEPPLFPGDAERRARIEEAERWGERELQPVPRRLFRWAVATKPELRRWLAREIVGMPAPNVMAALNAPVARVFARAVDANDAHVKADLVALPQLLDRVEELISEGTIGGDEPNAADFQIGTSVRVLLAFEDLRPLLAGRPASELAMRVLPKYPGSVPRVLPQDWLARVEVR